MATGTHNKRVQLIVDSGRSTGRRVACPVESGRGAFLTPPSHTTGHAGYAFAKGFVGTRPHPAGN